MEGQEAPVVLVTGSSGFIGSALCARLGPRFRVIGLDKETANTSEATLEVDLSSDQSVADVLNEVRARVGTRIASVVHLAAYYDFSGEPSPLYDEVTVRGTARLLAGLRDFDCDQFVFSSTMLVHAPTVPGAPIDEDSPLDPKWAYPKSKVDAEKLISDFPGGFRRVLLRIAGVYDDRCHSIPIAQQIKRIHERSLLAKAFPGDITHGQSFLHLDDLIDALVRVIDRRLALPTPQTFLLGEPETVSYDELQRTISKLIHGEEIETRRIPKPIAKAGTWVQEVFPGEAFIKPWMIDLADDHYELDIGRAHAALEWFPRRNLRESIGRIVRALLTDPEGWYRENHLGEPPKVIEPAPPPAP